MIVLFLEVILFFIMVALYVCHQEQNERQKMAHLQQTLAKEQERLQQLTIQHAQHAMDSRLFERESHICTERIQAIHSLLSKT